MKLLSFFKEKESETMKCKPCLDAAKNSYRHSRKREFFNLKVSERKQKQIDKEILEQAEIFAKKMTRECIGSTACLNEISMFTGLAVKDLLSPQFDDSKIDSRLIKAQYKCAKPIFKELELMIDYPGI